MLFPLSYALHIVEEAVGGESFPVWASRVSGASFTRDEFVVLNGVAFAGMCVAAAVAARTSSARHVVMPALGAIVAANGTLHVLASLWSATYSPGAISGATVWVPLGVWALRWSSRTSTTRQLLGGCILGGLAHAAISAVALFH